MKDYKALVKRLRVAVDVHEVKGCVLEISAETCTEIADTIEELERELAAARAEIDAATIRGNY